jgi:hypothetical protein
VADGKVETLVGDESAVADGPAAEATVEYPAGLVWDAARERLFFVEEDASVVRVLDLRAGEVRTVAGRARETGPADGALLDARFLMPSGAAYSRGEDALYVTDGGNGSVRRIDLGAGVVTTWLGDPSLQGNSAGAAPFESATLFMPHDPMIAGGALGLLAEGALLLARPAAPVSP